MSEIRNQSEASVEGLKPRSQQPQRWKMVVVVFVAVYPFSLFFSVFVLPHITHLPLLIRSSIFPVVLPILMVYLLLPFLTQRVFKGWLTNNKSRRS